MPLNPKSLEKILNIAHDTSIRGKGISISNALRESKYIELRERFSAVDVLKIIEEKPSFIEDWVKYSEDKRTSGGYYLSEKKIGSCRDKRIDLKYDSVQIATAEYVLKELDFWSEL